MIEPTTERGRRASAVAQRLKGLQVQLADESSDRRRDVLRDELGRVLNELVPAERRAFLAELKDSLPTPGDGEGAAKAASAPVDETPRDPRLLVDRLIAMSATMTDAQKKEIAERLLAGGFAVKQVVKEVVEVKVAAPAAAPVPVAAAPAAPASSDGGALPADALRELKAKLGLTEAERVDSAKVVELCTQLSDLTVQLDQFVWNAWKRVNPSSKFKKTVVMSRALGRFAVGDPAFGRAQVQAETKMLQGLTASLIAAVAKAGNLYAQKHLVMFAPPAIEEAARSEKRALEALGVTAWRKYGQLMQTRDENTIATDIQTTIASHAEELLDGLVRK